MDRTKLDKSKLVNGTRVTLDADDAEEGERFLGRWIRWCLTC